jgi:hypothetical protein
MTKNITLSADAATIAGARRKAAAENRTLNSAFREWLERYAGRRKAGEDYEDLMRRLRYVRVGRKFTREEMHER